MYMFPDEIEIDQPLEEWHGDTPLMDDPIVGQERQ
jgi:hypothetical protein